MKIILLALLLAQQSMAMPWIQGVELKLPRQIDPEKPIVTHPTDCHVFYMYNYPMTCGPDLVFNPDTLACQPGSEVASRPECASIGPPAEAAEGAEEKTGGKAPAAAKAPAAKAKPPPKAPAPKAKKT